MASSVIDWSQSRRTGLSESRCSTISRKISSPSRPASQALTISLTSLRASSFRMVRIRSPRPFSVLLGQDRQRVQGPALVLLVHLLGREQLEEVPHREGHDPRIALEVAVAVGEATEDLRDVARDARLLGDDQGL
jgi:hypothetical protein